MTLADIARFRLHGQQIAVSRYDSAKELVGYMGAMQAQDYAMAKWAVGLRLTASSDAAVEKALDDGEIIRTHVMRPTWHFVTAADTRWMIELTAPQIRTAIRSRHKQLEITGALLSKTYSILGKLLEGGRHATREEIVAAFVGAKIAVGDNRAAHLLACAELDALICSGASRGKKQTYALLDDRIPDTRTLRREEALHALARRYFVAHGPATLQDFVWWSGLTVSDARNALEMVQAELALETVDSKSYWFDPGVSVPGNSRSEVYLLPAFDEYLIAYKDRSAALDPSNFSRTISSNGIFWPVIVLDGAVKGLWKRTVKNNGVAVEAGFFQPANATVKSGAGKTAEQYARFLGKNLDFSVKSGSSPES